MGACCIILFLAMGILGTAGLYFSSLSDEWGISRAQVSMTMTFQMIVMTVMMPVAGKLISHYGIRFLSTVGAAIYGGAFIIGSFASSIYILYMAWALVGASFPFLSSLTTNTILGNWFKKKLGMVMGISASIAGIGAAVLNPIIGYFIDKNGWRSAYRLSGIIMIAVLLPVCTLLLRKQPAGEQKPFGYDEDSGKAEASGIAEGVTFKQAAVKPYFYILAAAQIILTFICSAFAHIPSHVVNVGYVLTLGAFAMSTNKIGDAVGKILFGTLLDSIRPQIAMLLYMVTGVAGLLGVALSPNIPLIMVSSFILGMSNSIVQVGVPFYIRRIFGNCDFSQIMSVIGMCGT